MYSSENVTEFLKQLTEKKNSLQKATLRLMLESKDVIEHMDSTKERFNKCLIDLKSRCKGLESDRDCTLERNKELDALRESLELRMKEIQCREENFYSFQKTQMEEFKMKEGQLAEIRMWVLEKMQEIDSKEEKLSELKNSMEVLLDKFKVEKQEFKDIQKSASKSLEEVSFKERSIEDGFRKLNIFQDSVERWSKELYLEEEKVELRERELKTLQISYKERFQKLGIVTRELDCARKLIEEKSEKLDLKEKQLNSVEKNIHVSLNEFHARSKWLEIVKELLEKQLEDQSKFFERKRKQLEEEFNDFQLTKRQLEEPWRDLESKKKQIEEWNKDFELNQKLIKDIRKTFESGEKQQEELSKEVVLKEKQLVVDLQVKVGQVSDRPSLELPTKFDSMDGRCLQIYLNENCKEYESASSEVCQILESVSNPRKLVIDAMEGFYPPHLKKGDVDSKTSVVRRSCILLLEQLMRLSPKIEPNMKKEALILAAEWKVKMVVLPINPLEVLAFILLLASYNLASNFEADDVLRLLKFIKRNLVPRYSRLLGLQEKVRDFIRRLVERRLHLEAIEYVCVFNVVDKFPPAILLNDYISYEKEAAGKILEEGLYSVKSREVACLKELNALKAVMSCIILHELESQYPFVNIKIRIKQLENRRIHQQTLAHSSPKARRAERFDSRTEERDTKKHKGLSSNTPSSTTPLYLHHVHHRI